MTTDDSAETKAIRALNQLYENNDKGMKELAEMPDERPPISVDELFTEWFNDLYGLYTCRSEWFYGDCEVGDENTRKSLLFKWVHAAFIAGYEAQHNQKKL